MRMLRDTKGTALVEFAIVMPILVLLLVGIFELGRAYSAYSTVRAASAEGAHWAALHPTATVDDIRAQVLKRVVPLNGDLVEVEASWDDGAGAQDFPIAASEPVRIVPIRVTVTYPLSSVLVTGLIRAFVPSGMTGFTATATADALR